MTKATGSPTLDAVRDMMVTHNGALNILRAHSAENDWYEFLDEVTPDATGLFRAYDVFVWLGY